jgi:hypothetical protein
MSLVDKRQTLGIAFCVVVELLPFIFVSSRALWQLRQNADEEDRNQQFH